MAERQTELATKRLTQAVEVADEVNFTIDRDLENLAGAAEVRKKLLDGGEVKRGRICSRLDKIQQVSARRNMARRHARRPYNVNQMGPSLQVSGG